MKLTPGRIAERFRGGPMFPGLIFPMSCLDVGSGPGAVMRLMADRVGPEGRVTGIEIDGALGAEALQDLRREGGAGFEQITADLLKLEAPAGVPFDLTFCRLLLMTTAALGGQVEVPTIDGGKSKVKIPEGTESGKQFRIKSKGMPVLRSKQQGDLYIQVEVETPKSLTRKQRELLKEFENASNESTSPASTGFFARVKEFFEGQ